MKTTRNELYHLLEALKAAGNHIGIKFNYALCRNIDKITSELKDTERTGQPLPAYQDYEKDRIELCKEMAKKDSKGKPVIITKPGGQQEFDLEDVKEFELELEQLKIPHREAIDDREEQQKKYQEYLAEEFDFEMYMVDEEHIPEKITGNQLTGVMPMIIFEEELKTAEAGKK